MNDGFVVTCTAVRASGAQQDNNEPVLWERGKPIPSIPNSKIERMIVVGDAVDVFAVRVDAGGRQSGMHMRMPSPIVLYTIETSSRDAWNEAKEDDVGRDFTQLLDQYLRQWVVNQPIAGWGASTVRITCNEFGAAIVYALPEPGTRAANEGRGIRVTFFAQTGFFLMTEGLTLNEMADLQAEVDEEAEGEPDVEPGAVDPEEEEEEQEEIVAAPDPHASGVNGVVDVPPPPPPPVAPPGIPGDAS